MTEDMDQHELDKMRGLTFLWVLVLAGGMTLLFGGLNATGVATYGGLNSFGIARGVRILAWSPQRIRRGQPC